MLRPSLHRNRWGSNQMPRAYAENQVFGVLWDFWTYILSFETNTAHKVAIKYFWPTSTLSSSLLKHFFLVDLLSPECSRSNCAGAGASWNTAHVESICPLQGDNRELEQPRQRRRRQQERNKSAYLIMKNNSFARALFIFGHFADVLVLLLDVKWPVL